MNIVIIGGGICDTGRDLSKERIVIYRMGEKF